jgi:hypothetical protein
MKQFFLLGFCLLMAILVKSQSIVKGRITSFDDGTPISNATIKLTNGNQLIINYLFNLRKNIL